MIEWVESPSLGVDEVLDMSSGVQTGTIKACPGAIVFGQLDVSPRIVTRSP
jgi:hypothetical protein